jgi:prolyl-tRNA editing enzyme YbaK/EbsC (Cys-tRNA(Pro) deacylase)
VSHEQYRDAVSDHVSRILDHPAVTRVRAALRDLGISAPITVLDDAARTAAQAAEQLGVTVAQIANSLVFAARRDEESPTTALLVMASGGHRVDTDLLADTLGLSHLGRADAALVKQATGFAIGGVAPVGHLTAMPTVVDTALAAYDVVWAAAGHPHAVFPTTYADLVAMTGGTPAPVARDEDLAAPVTASLQ